QSQATNETGGVVLTVTAGGTPPLSYQWVYADNVLLDGATNSTFVLNGVTFDETGDYTVVVSNEAGDAVSDAAFVNINPEFALAASSSPAGSISPSGSVLVSAGASQTFTATPGGSAAVDYWYVDGEYAQAGGNSFTLSNVQSSHVVSAGFGDTVDVGIAMQSSEGFGLVDVGTNFTYSITVTNNGSAAATDVQVSDVLPEEVAFVSATSTQGT